jgi:pseudaminic acid cytidylyltransferase
MKLAVIPARGGSKRIPRKNVKPFAGRPMIAYAIEAARSSKLFDEVVVSTDDREIAAVARECGAAVPFARPAELADDTTPTVPVIAHAVETCRTLGFDVDLCCCIYPSVPLLHGDDLREALAILQAGEAPYVFPVAPFPSAVQRALRRRPDGRTEPFYPQYANTRTQDLEPAYYDAGQFYWGRAEAWLARLNVHHNGATIVLPEWRVVDIDTPDDWLRAEAVFHALQTAA